MNSDKVIIDLTVENSEWIVTNWRNTRTTENDNTTE